MLKYFYVISFLSLLLVSQSLFALDKIKEVGKVDFDKQSQTFFFSFIKNNKVQTIIIHPTDKNEVELLKSMNGKMVVLDGEINTVVKNKEGFSFREELNNSKVRELNKELLKIDTKKIITQYNLVSHERKFTQIKSNDGAIGLSNKTANSVISVAGTLVGIAAGPISLMPAAAYLINEGLSK